MTRPYHLPRNAWQIVAGREMVVKLADKSFIISTVITLVLIAAGVGVGAWLGGRATTTDIAVTDAQAGRVVVVVDASLKASNDKSSATPITVASPDEAKAKVRAGDADAALLHTDAGWQLVFHKSASDSVRMAVNQAVQTVLIGDLASQAGVSPDELAQRTAVKVELLEGDSSRADLARVTSFAFAILFFMSALTFGLQIAQSVAEEKSSRVVEILASAIPVRHLLAGKVIGNTGLALGQMALYALVSIVGLMLTPWKKFLPAVQAPMAWFLVFFLAGFLALACVWAAAGSMAGRTEDLSATTTPLTMGLGLVYFLGFTATGALQTVLSFVPVISSVLMPTRIVAGDVAWWEPVLALVLNIAFAFVTVLFGEKIFRRSLLQTSGRLSYREAFKLTD
ncbi:ABC transporter permease [Aestuariimicrobium ganziense]|uniref:ABC transporter permease n=1 Tax=Aestuariimicrobium ganziense TaxID=2773677 RepID=UPI00194255C3|nr:ABC transporter permease [Aestuariimicrobium ganziense]